jgi:hypothetical protein
MYGETIHDSKAVAEAATFYTKCQMILIYMLGMRRISADFCLRS